MAGKFIKGALVEFIDGFVIPVPNVIAFQFNPEKMTHTWTQSQADEGARKGEQANPLAVKGNPGESFNFTLELDAADTIVEGNPVSAGLATASGVYSRLAALEMLQYPVAAKKTNVVGSVSLSLGGGGASLGGLAGGGGAAQTDVPALQLPTVLFIWGPGRILPVRVTSLTITETLYDALLNPVHAEVQITLQVMTPEELESATGPLADLAKAAYDFSQGLRKGLAIANLTNTADSVLGMLPVP